MLTTFAGAPLVVDGGDAACLTSTSSGLNRAGKANWPCALTAPGGFGVAPAVRAFASASATFASALTVFASALRVLASALRVLASALSILDMLPVGLTNPVWP